MNGQQVQLTSAPSMQANGTLKLLLIHDDQNEANRLVSLLRNAKYKVEPTYTDSPEVTAKLLQEKPWDMILAQFESKKLPYKDIFPHLRRLNLDLPVILISDDFAFEKFAEGIRLGAGSTLPMDEDQVLLTVISRILYNLEKRRELRYWKRRYNESEARSQRLLQSSKDAIAIVQEGTYLYTNEAYANLFGYLNPEAMICLPVMDTIAPEHQDLLKKHLKPLSSEKSRKKQILRFTGITCDESPIPIECVVTQIEYQNEPTLEFLITNDQLLNSDMAQINSYVGIKSGAPIQRHHTMEQIDSAIHKAAQQSNTSALLYITIDRYQQLQDEVGYQIMEHLVIELMQQLENHIDKAHSLNRFKEESFLLLLNDSNADYALELAEQLCGIIRAQPLEINQQTFNITLSIGVSAISEAVTSPEGCIFRCLHAITELQSSATEPNYGNGAQLYEADISTVVTSEFDVDKHGQLLLDNHQLELFYQPIITLHGEAGEFYEVLLRVSAEGNPKDLPIDFIDKLFKTELSGKIDRWVIIESVKVLAKKLKTHPNTKLFINISNSSICDKGFIAWLKVTIKASGISPKQLTFQLREIDVWRHQKHATAIIKDLNNIQSKVALSHFGLAIDPLQLLKRVHVDFVKFDSVVIEKTQRDGESNLEDIEQLISSLKEAEEKIIVPFVENAVMIPSLWQYGIHYIQGHFLQPPSATMNFDFNSEE